MRVVSIFLSKSQQNSNQFIVQVYQTIPLIRWFPTFGSGPFKGLLMDLRGHQLIIGIHKHDLSDALSLSFLVN